MRLDSPPRRASRQDAAASAAGGFEVCGTLSDGAHHGGGLNGQDAYTGRILPVVPYDLFQITAPINRQNRDERSPCHTLARDNASHAAVVQTMSVRRLTPTECERLQGFPDGWTAIPWKNRPVSECPDGPRYRALGNSMAVNVMRWIGRRIELVDAL
jgi:DNA (cytosine-5)-methyltransferase 1